MGFYKSHIEKQQAPHNNRAGGASVKFIATVVLSALVGAGATMGVFALTGRFTPSSTNSVATVPPVTTTATNLSGNSNDWISNVVKTVEPSIAAVVNYTEQTSGYGGSSTSAASDVGTSVLIQKTGQVGYFVTNNHVVVGSTKVQLVLSSGKKVPGKVVGTDEYTDLAVISVQDKYISGIQPLQFASSKNLQAGQPVVAIGTPEGLNFADSVTSGIISGPKRIMPVEDPNNDNVIYDYQSVIQTDAPINPGNSGGPLLNSSGQVLGINCSKIVATGVENMGFAIPSEEVTQIANEIIQTGHATHTALGISAEDVDQMVQQYGGPTLPVNYGVYVAAVDSSAAKAAGLKRGDVIVDINGQKIQNSADMRTILFGSKSGSTVTLKVYRGSKLLTLKVKLTSLQSPNDTGANAGTSSGSSSSGSGDGSGSGSPFGGNPFSFFGGGF
ncbi:S1C family serine protease [Alicyclobacillus fodiniaquatilis]|uniref:S1C family serine protease n=1 Tax=Alicyclobacillus fodiniaquatilis TaxID=1661150 RepID=A0ABW4JRH4_9BACL